MSWLEDSGTTTTPGESDTAHLSRQGSVDCFSEEHANDDSAGVVVVVVVVVVVWVLVVVVADILEESSTTTLEFMGTDAPGPLERMGNGTSYDSHNESLLECVCVCSVFVCLGVSGKKRPKTNHSITPWCVG